MNELEHFTEIEKYETKNFVLKKILNKFIYDISQLIYSLKLKKNSIILDAGCGDGFLMKEIKNRNKNLKFYGLDILEKSINYAKKLNNDSEFIIGDVEELPLKDNSVDVVLCSEVLEHLKHPEKVLSEIKKISRRYAIICVPYEPYFTIANLLRFKYVDNFGNYPGHIQKFGRKKIHKILKNYFRKVMIKRSTFWLIALCEK